jgi:hypothetical protein
MALLTRDQILAADDISKETVKVPEWGGEVIIAGMNAAARDAWEQTLIGDEKHRMENIAARLVSYCAVDDKGNRLFTDADVKALGAKSSRALARCVKAAQRLNGLTGADLEDLAKN